MGVKIKSFVSSVLKRTGTQDTETVINMDLHFHLKFGGETFLINEVEGNTVGFSKDKEARDRGDDPDEPTSKTINQ